MNRKRNLKQKRVTLHEWLNRENGGGHDDSKVSGTQNQIDEMKRQLDSIVDFQSTMVESLKQLTMNQTAQKEKEKDRVESRARGPNHPDKRNVQVNPIPEPSLNQLLYMQHEDSIQSRFMQASALLKPLKGNEGRTGVESYFRHFEAITYGWSDTRRAALLATHLEGQARLTFESLSEQDQQSYALVKDTIVQRYNSTNSNRIKAQNEVMQGIRRRPNENFLDYGLRVLRTVQDSVLPGVPEEAIEDMASTHLLRYIGDPLLYSSLAPHKQNMTYHQFLDQAVMLESMNDATGYSGYNYRNSSKEYAGQWTRNPNDYTPDSRFTPMRTNYSQSPPLPQHQQNLPRPLNQAPYQNRENEPKPTRNAGQVRYHPTQNQSQRNNPRVAAIDPSRRVNDEEVVEVETSEDMPQRVQFPTVTCSYSVGEAIGPRTDANLSSRIQLVPAINHPDKGITHRLVHLEGPDPDIFIGMPCGPQPIVHLKLHGVDVECLLDAGSQVNVISRDCIEYIIEKAKLSRSEMKFHPPVNPVCRAANESKIHFTEAVSLPIKRGGLTIWIELQVPKTQMPKPVVLGTNGLIALGYEVVDKMTGEHLLSNKTSSTLAERGTESREFAPPVQSTIESVTSSYSVNVGQASAEVMAKNTERPTNTGLNYCPTVMIGTCETKGSSCLNIPEVCASGEGEGTSGKRQPAISEPEQRVPGADSHLKGAHVVFLSDELASHKEFVSGSFSKKIFSNISALGILFLNSVFTSEVREVLILLPPAKGDNYAEIVKAILEHASKYPHVQFYVIPPPPVLSPIYESTVDVFSDAFSSGKYANMSRLEKRMKTFWSVGWSGSGRSPNNFHSRDGLWTGEGRKSIMMFMREALGVSWPFKSKVKHSENRASQSKSPGRKDSTVRIEHRVDRHRTISSPSIKSSELRNQEKLHPSEGRRSIARQQVGPRARSCDFTPSRSLSQEQTTASQSSTESSGRVEHVRNCTSPTPYPARVFKRRVEPPPRGGGM